MTRGQGRRVIVGAGLVGALVGAGLAASPLGPAAHAGPLPPPCDPRVAGLSAPGCPSALLREAGRVERPGVALPDLVPDIGDVYVEYEAVEPDGAEGWRYGPAQLRFGTLAQNRGPAPFDLRADDPTALAGSPVSQCISWTTSLVCRERRPVGGFVWHDDHKHYHFDGFASYELRQLLADGSPDFSIAGLVAASPKVSYCLVDSRRVFDDAAPTPRYNTCNPLEGGVSPGWADHYPAELEGQALPLTGVTDGRYALVISLDRDRRVFETTPSNNRMVALIELAHLETFSPHAQIVEKGIR